MIFMNHVDYCSQFIETGGTVLDIGSGRGDFLCEMARRGFSTSGIEYNPDNVVLSLKKARERGLTVDIRQGSAERLPFLDNNFDFANCAEVTEHVDNPEQVCREMYRVLKQNRHGYISFTNRFSIYDCHFHLLFINFLPRTWAEFLLNLFKKNKNDISSGRQTLLKMHYFTYSQAITLLKRCGFNYFDTREVKLKKYFDSLSPFVVSFYIWFVRPIVFSTFHFLVEKPTKSMIQ